MLAEAIGGRDPYFGDAECIHDGQRGLAGAAGVIAALG